MIYRLSAERYEEIKEIIVDLFERLSIQCIPISGFEIATKLGVIVVPYSSKPIETRRLMLEESEDGFSVKKGGHWYIFITTKMSIDVSIIQFVMNADISY